MARCPSVALSEMNTGVLQETSLKFAYHHMMSIFACASCFLFILLSLLLTQHELQ